MPGFLDEPARLTSGLNEAINDTGRIAFCGPVVLSAITGYSIGKVEDEIRRFRNLAEGQRPAVKGTQAEEVAAALAHFGYGAFRDHHHRMQALLEDLAIPCDYQDGPERKHVWESGWVGEAVAALDAMSR